MAPPTLTYAELQDGCTVRTNKLIHGLDKCLKSSHQQRLYKRIRDGTLWKQDDNGQWKEYLAKNKTLHEDRLESTFMALLRKEDLEPELSEEEKQFHPTTDRETLPRDCHPAFSSSSLSPRTRPATC